MKVLVVDDDEIILESCRRVLETEGMSVHVAEDAETARTVLEHEAPVDLILTDIKMPGQDGFQLIHQAREACPEIAVLMMTGYLIPETLQKGAQRGADGFIAKPFTPRELLGSVNGVLSLAKGRR